MKSNTWVLLCLLVVAASANTAQNHESSLGFVHIQSVDVPYESKSDNPALGYAVLSGDPNQAGTYVIRLNIPPGLTFPPLSFGKKPVMSLK